MYELILASQSPRRKELLEKAGFTFSIGSVELSEKLSKNMSLDDALMELAEQKAKAFVSEHKSLNSKNILVLSADTVVVDQDLVLGKPKDQIQAYDYLMSLSGRTHSVKTAFCILNLKLDKSFKQVVTSTVEFKVLSEKVVKDYVATGEPMDKAGAYAIQGQGRELVKQYFGSWDNIVGLPVSEVREALKTCGWQVD